VPSSFPPSVQTSYPPSGPSGYPTPTQAPTLPQVPTMSPSGGQYQQAPMSFAAPQPQMAQFASMTPSYASMPTPARKPRTVRWVLFAIWLVLGFIISLFVGATIAVLIFGQDPPDALVWVLTLLLYLAGAITLLIWCRI
jgi:hypothetical protein